MPESSTRTKFAVLETGGAWADGAPPDAYADRLRRQRDAAWDDVAALRRELTESRARAEAYRYAAYHDELTGLPNRRALNEHAARLVLPRAGWLACAVVDLDAFKAINDRYGHATGDAVLAEVGGRLGRHVHGGPGRFAARLGGDEFTVILTNGGPLQARLASAAAALADLFELALVLPNGKSLALTASIGVAASPTVSLTELLARADAAMYRAKRDRSGQPGCRVHLDTDPDPESCPV